MTKDVTGDMTPHGPEYSTVPNWRAWLTEAPCSDAGPIPLGYAKAISFAISEIARLQKRVSELEGDGE